MIRIDYFHYAFTVFRPFWFDSPWWPPGPHCMEVSNINICHNFCVLDRNRVWTDIRLFNDDRAFFLFFGELSL